MSLARALRINRILLVVNAAILALLIGFVVWSWDQFGANEVIEARKIVLRGSNGIPSIILQGDADNTLMTLNDDQGNVRLQLQGGTFPAVIMKNDAQEIIGTFFPLRDGGSALGLGDAEGNMATFIRGGVSPTMSFYKQSHEPNLSMGIANELPHFVMFPMAGKEGMIIHGNNPTSVLFIDENGEVPISLSRYGLYQHGPEAEHEQESLTPEEKVFSYRSKNP